MTQPIRPSPWLDSPPEDASARRWLPSLAQLVLALTGGAWLGLAILAAAGIEQARVIAIDLAIAGAPLGLIVLLWLPALRPPRGVGDAALRRAAPAELHALVERLVEERAALADQVAMLEESARGTVRDIAASALTLAEEILWVDARAREVDTAAAAMQARIATAIVDLPDAEVRLRGLAEELRGAQEAAGAAARQLSGEIGRIGEAGADAGRNLELVAASMARAGNDAVERALGAIEGMQPAIEGRLTALEEAAARARATIDRGADRLQPAGEQIDAAEARLDRFAARIASERDAAEAMMRSLEHSLDGIEERFRVLGDTAAERTADMAERLATLGERAGGVVHRLGETAEAVHPLARRSGASVSGAATRS